MRDAVRILLLAGLGALTGGCTRYDPYHPDTSHLKGVWAIDNNLSRRGQDAPVLKRLTVYATHMEFCPGQGTRGTEGEWRGDGFWCPAKDGSGEIEAAKVVSPETLELHLAAFDAGSVETLLLYKEKGSDEENQAAAEKYPAPYVYPPPYNLIVEGMTEYELRMLPWKPEKVLPSPYHPDLGETVYYYRSDDPQRSELEVTVRNHVVVRTSGGNA